MATSSHQLVCEVLHIKKSWFGFEIQRLLKGMKGWGNSTSTWPRLLLQKRCQHVSNLNYFFQNSKAIWLRDGQSFFDNRSFAGHRRPLKTVTRPKSMREARQPKAQGEDSHFMRDVAVKVLNCRDVESKVLQEILSQESLQHIPFPVKPKQASLIVSRPKVTKTTVLSFIMPYWKLTKPNLTILVTLSSICSYAVSPLSVSLPELCLLTLGTALCSGSANAINMAREPDFDRQMPRTVGRPIVRGLLTPRDAYIFAGIIGIVGVTILYNGVNQTVALLGAANIVLYSWIYTSLKRRTILNTWVGALVGAIPPLMGWASSSSLSNPGAWCLAALLFAWQFPHFNALSHNIASQYKKAGYVMTAAENPMLNARVALRYSILMFPICFGLCYFDVTDWGFLLDSSLANGWLTLMAYRFWNQQRINHARDYKPSEQQITAANVQAKKLFWGSVWQLPAVLVLAMLHKKGQWHKLYNYLFGTCNEDNDDKRRKNKYGIFLNP